MISQRFAFTAGEWSPLLWAHADLEAYGKALKRAENLLPSSLGPLRNRPGTEFIALAKYADKKCRLEEFSFSTSTNFILELGHLYARFFSNGQAVTVDSVPVEVVTPYTEAQLFEVQLRQEKDVVYFTHPSHPPQRLTRLGDTSWEWIATPFTAWPYEDVNSLAGLTVAANAKSGAGVILTASEAIFEAGHAASRIRIFHRRDETPPTVPLTGNGSSDAVFARGEVTIQTSGTWAATLILQQSYDNGATWEAAYTLTANSDRNHEAVVSIDTRSLVRLTVAEYKEHSGDVAPMAYLIASDAWHEGVCYIDTVLSGTQAVCTVESPLFSTDVTDYWAFCAWSDANGYPGAIELHDSRIWYAGTAKAPLTLWASVLGDFENMQDGSFADDAMGVTMASAQNNRIEWIQSYQKSLFIGTTAAEWTLQNRIVGETLSPTNFQFELRSSYGSCALPAQQIGDALLFCLGNRREVRDLTYIFNRDAYTGIDVSQSGEHLLRSGIVQSAYATEPERLVWYITPDGLAASFAYEKDLGLMAWHRHTTQNGLFESVASVLTPGGAEVWFSVARTFDGVTRRYIERLEPDTDTKRNAGLDILCLFADCGKRITAGSPQTVFSGFDHLEGQTLAVMADGATRNPVTVVNGSITLDHAATQLNAGLPLCAKGEILDLVAPKELGTTAGCIARVHRILASVYQTRGFEYTVFGADADEDDWYPAYARTQADPLDRRPALYSGEYDLTAPPRIARGLTVAFRQTLPQPVTIRSLVVEWNPTEKTA